MLLLFLFIRVKSADILHKLIRTIRLCDYYSAHAANLNVKVLFRFVDTGYHGILKLTVAIIVVIFQIVALKPHRNPLIRQRAFRNLLRTPNRRNGYSNSNAKHRAADNTKSYHL